MMIPVAVDDDCSCFGTADKLFRDPSSFCHDKKAGQRRSPTYNSTLLVVVILFSTALRRHSTCPIET